MKEIQVRISQNVERRVKLNINTLFVYSLLKGRTSGMTEYINLEFSGNDKGHDQSTEKVIFARYYY